MCPALFVQGEATSVDGTKVPYFLLRPPGAGPAPTLLYGYGGFRISQTPGYASLVGAGWLQAGGSYVVANIRGGGEFGPDWHAAALRENRSKVPPPPPLAAATHTADSFARLT